MERCGEREGEKKIEDDFHFSLLNNEKLLLFEEKENRDAA